jgi:hypothetical protein
MDLLLVLCCMDGRALVWHGSPPLQRCTSLSHGGYKTIMIRPAAQNGFNLQACLCESFSSLARLRNSPQWVHRLSIDHGRTGTAIFEDIAHASTRYVWSTNALQAVGIRRRCISHSVSYVQASCHITFSVFVFKGSHPCRRRPRGIGTLGGRE